MLSTMTYKAACMAKSQTRWLQMQSEVIFIKPSWPYEFWTSPIKKQVAKRSDWISDWRRGRRYSSFGIIEDEVGMDFEKPRLLCKEQLLWWSICLRVAPGTLFSEGIAQYTEQEEGGKGKSLTTRQAVLWPSLSVSCLSWVYCMPVIPALGRLGQYDCCKCKDSLGSIWMTKPTSRRG